MSVESAKQDVKVSFGKDFVIMGTDRIEVSPDGKKVTAWTNDGVETKAASEASPAQGSSFTADFNTVVLNGAIIKRAADGHLVISAPGGIVKQAAPANNSAAKTKTAIEIGDLDDGGVYVGLSAENGKPLHAALWDLPDYKTYEEALAAAEQLKAAHPTAHVPTSKELDKNLFDNRNTGHLKDTFNTSGLICGRLYRSSAASWYDGSARVQWFDNGEQHHHGFGRNLRLPVRLVW